MSERTVARRDPWVLWVDVVVDDNGNVVQRQVIFDPNFTPEDFQRAGQAMAITGAIGALGVIAIAFPEVAVPAGTFILRQHAAGPNATSELT